jgi:hypothetical protein
MATQINLVELVVIGVEHLKFKQIRNNGSQRSNKYIFRIIIAFH